MTNKAFQLAKFKPGVSGNPAGRPKKLLLRIDEMCKKDNVHPYTELMKLMPLLDESDQADVWLQLLSYIQPKPKEEPIEDEVSKLEFPQLIQEVLQSLRDMGCVIDVKLPPELEASKRKDNAK